MPRKAARKRSAHRRSAIPVFRAQQVSLGDRIRVERRFIVDGRMTSVCDQGVFHGIQAMGSVEHVLLERKGEVHLIPIPSISEIVLEEAHPASEGPGPGHFDPSIA